MKSQTTKTMEKIFSVKNETKNGKKMKVVTILGAKVKFNKNKISQKIEDLSIKYDPRLSVGIPEDLTLQMMFNNTCNCKCKFCFADIAHKKEDVRIFSDKQLYKDFLPLYPHTKNLVPTDGEITAASNSLEWLNFIDKNFPKINIFLETNGIAFDEKWSDFAVKNLAVVNFSLNAINEEYFKKTVWDKDGIFNLIERNFNSYLKKLKEKGLSALNPSVSIVLNETNYDTIEAFIKKHIQNNIRNIIVFFDCNQKLDEISRQKIEQTFTTLIEIERLVKDKLQLGFELFVPIDNVPDLRKMVYMQDVEAIKRKHQDIWNLIKDWENLNSFFAKRIQLRREAGKKDYDLYEAKTGVTFHQHIHRGRVYCDNPWTHIRVSPAGISAPCSWYPYHPDQNINNYRNERGDIDWAAYFDNPRRKKQRYYFERGCYIDCMHNCPGAKDMTAKEFNELYKSKEY